MAAAQTAPSKRKIKPSPQPRETRPSLTLPLVKDCFLIYSTLGEVGRPFCQDWQKGQPATQQCHLTSPDKAPQPRPAGPHTTLAYSSQPLLSVTLQCDPFTATHAACRVSAAQSVCTLCDVPTTTTPHVTAETELSSRATGLWPAHMQKLGFLPYSCGGMGLARILGTMGLTPHLRGTVGREQCVSQQHHENWLSTRQAALALWSSALGLCGSCFSYHCTHVLHRK